MKITDNGVGMKEQTVRMLNEELADTDTQTLVSNVDRGNRTQKCKCQN